MTDFTDEAVSAAARQLEADESPLVRIFGDTPRVQILAALIAAEQPLTGTELREHAEIPETRWRGHRDRLRSAGLLERANTTAPDDMDAPEAPPRYELPETEIAAAVTRVARLATPDPGTAPE